MAVVTVSQSDSESLNTDAVAAPTNNVICDRTGFRVMPGGLKQQWDGFKVRPKSWDARHPQDFVRAGKDEQKGSPRPEPADTFVVDVYGAAGPSAADDY